MATLYPPYIEGKLPAQIANNMFKYPIPVGDYQQYWLNGNGSGVVSIAGKKYYADDLHGAICQKVYLERGKRYYISGVFSTSMTNFTDLKCWIVIKRNYGSNATEVANYSVSKTDGKQQIVYFQKSGTGVTGFQPNETGYYYIYFKLHNSNENSYGYVENPYLSTVECKSNDYFINKITIPYQLNRATDFSSIQNSTINAKLSLVSTGAQVGEMLTAQVENNQERGIYTATFVIENGLLQIGQHYKIQLSFGDSGLLSTVGVFKATIAPQLSFEEKLPSVIGQYFCEDAGEKVVEYKFDVYDASDNNKLLETSDWLIHDSNTNIDNNNSYDTYNIISSIFEKYNYTIKYTVKTINGLIIEKTSTKKMQNAPVTAEIIDRDNTFSKNGRIEIALKKLKNSSTVNNQHYYLYRNSELIQTIKCTPNSTDKKYTFIDNYTEFGKSYTYTVYWNDGSGARKDSVTLVAWSDDIVLNDNLKTYYIKFNPGISSMKTTTLEAKMDTLGGKYPFFFRNGRVAYKEFPITGLISCRMEDDESTELTRESSNLYENLAVDADDNINLINLTTDNFYTEREYKLEMMNWLNNGKPKIFKSPAEGSYIVRLMTISLAPETKLGRMLHTFTATAYEVGDFDMKTLKELGFVEEEVYV